MFEKSWGIYGLDYESACVLMDRIEQTCGKEVAHRFRNKRSVYTEFVDGTKLLWMPRDVCHAKRVGRLWCDKKIKKMRPNMLSVEFIWEGIKTSFGFKKESKK